MRGRGIGEGGMGEWKCGETRVRLDGKEWGVKELSLCHKLWFTNPNIFATQCRAP